MSTRAKCYLCYALIPCLSAAASFGCIQFGMWLV